MPLKAPQFGGNKAKAFGKTRTAPGQVVERAPQTRDGTKQAVQAVKFGKPRPYQATLKMSAGGGKAIKKP